MMPIPLEELKNRNISITCNKGDEKELACLLFELASLPNFEAIETKLKSNKDKRVRFEAQAGAREEGKETKGIDPSQVLEKLYEEFKEIGKWFSDRQIELSDEFNVNCSWFPQAEHLDSLFRCWLRVQAEEIMAKSKG